MGSNDKSGAILKDKELVELVCRGQGGDREAVAMLSELAAERLLPYIHRLTLNYDVAQDILQETLLHLVKSLGDLKQQESFWSWIFRMARGKVQHYYRDRSREKDIMMRTFREGWNRCQDSNLTGYDYVLRKELSEIIVHVVGKLNINQRTVLALRCYEDMPYSQIAEVMKCKEMAARVLFYRAKRLMRKGLIRRGFSKEHLMLALGLFGAITAKSEAVSATSCVTASMLNVGALAILISALSSRAAMATTSLFTLFGVLATTKSFLFGLGIALLVICIMFWVWLANLYSE